METIVVKTVEGPNDRGWFQVELADGRTPATKEKKLAELAFKHRDTEVQAEIGEKVNGTFKNLFLNKLEVADGTVVQPVNEKPATVAENLKAGIPSPIPPSRDEQKQKDIAAQWAVGRAVEVFLSGGPLVNLPLTQAFLSQIEQTATEFAAIRDRLAGK